MEKLILVLFLLCCGAVNAAELDFSSFKHIGVGHTGGRLSVGYVEHYKYSGNTYALVRDGGKKNYTLTGVAINCDAETYKLLVSVDYSNGVKTFDSGEMNLGWGAYVSNSPAALVAKHVCK